MANSIENRIVNMVFNNAKFEEGVKQTLGSLNKLDEVLKKLDSSQGLANLQKSLDQLNFAKMGANADAAKGKVDFSEQARSFDELEQKSSRISFGGILRGLAAIKSKFTFGRDAQQQFGQAETASRNVKFAGANQAVDQTRQNISGVGSGADAAFNDVNNAASRVSLNPLIAGTQAATQGFSVLKGAASVALGSIAAQAASTGAGLLKDLSLGPITDGFSEYATNLSSIQTILANTQADGTNLQDVNKALAELNHYSDQTIYNFGEMAKNIGTFTAAGVDLKTSTESIKGIANLAALSGSNSGQASAAMYQLSQAIAAGKVNLEDWNSVVNSGMGGKVFQKALFDTGKAMGTITNSPVGQTFKEWEKAGNSFRQSLSATQKQASDGTSELKEAQKDAAKSIKDAQENAAESVENAQQRVKDAQKGVAEAAKQGAEDVKNAVKAQQDAVEQGAENVKSAFEALKEARRRLKEAMKPPSSDELEASQDAVKSAQLDQKGLADAVTEAQRKQKRAGDDLAAAQNNLYKLQLKNAPAEDILDAQNALQDAQKAVRDSADDQERALLAQRAAARGVNEAEKELQETRRKGTKNDENVKAAQDDVTAALKQYRDTQVQAREDVVNAEKRVTEARQNAAARQKQAGENLAEAEKQQAKTIKNAAESVATAQENAAKRVKTAKDQMAQAAGGMGPPSWLTSDVLTNTLKQFTGDLTDAQLKAKGFSDEQIKAIQQTAQTAKKAATEVKTIKQVFEVAKESIGSGFAQTFQLIFGNFNESKKTFTGFSTAIGEVINKSANARNQVLKDWRELGGRSVLFDGLKEAIRGIGEILKPIKQGFRDIFPAQTGKSLYELTVRFREFAKSIQVAPETADKVRRTFAGLFSVFKIGINIVKAIGSGLKAMFDEVKGDGGGGFLNLTASIGDFLVAVNKAIEDGQGLTRFFQGLGRILAIPLKLLGYLAQKIANLFSGFNDDDSTRVNANLSGVSDSLSGLQDTTDKFARGFEVLKEKLSQGAEAIKDAFSSILDAIKETFTGASYDDILSGVQVGLFGGFLLLIRRFLNNGLFNNLTGGLIEKVGGTFEALTSHLEKMQQSVNADILKKIAIALGLLTASIVALSLIDGAKLAKALAAVALGMGQLMAAMAIMTKLSGAAGFVKIPILATSLILLAAAVDVLAIAVAALSRLSWEELLKGLTGVGVLLGGITVAAGPLAAAGPGMIRSGVGLIAVAAALNILAIAVKKFGDMDVKTIATGLVSITAALTGIGLAMKLFPAGMVGTGVGLLAVATAMSVLAGAVNKFGNMDLSTIGKGLGAIAAALGVLGAAMILFPPNMVAIGAGLVLVASGIRIMAGALKRMGDMSVGEIAKSLVTLAGSLGILAVALTAMTGTVGGSAALLLAATAMAVLAPALRILGGMKWSSIAKGLVVLAGALAAFSATAFALAPVVPAMLALSVALIGLGAAMVLAGAGIALLSTGLSALAVSGPAGIAIMVKAIESFISIVPNMAVKFTEAIVKMVVTLAENAPKLVAAMGALLSALLQVIINVAPKIAEAFTSVIQAGLTALENNVPRFIEVGFKLLTSFLSGIANNIGKVTEQVGSIIVNFLNALAQKIPDIVAAGANLLAKFLYGVASNIAKVIAAGANLVVKFLEGVAKNLGKVLEAGGNLIVKLLEGIANQITKIVSKGTDIIVKFIGGMANASTRLITAGKNAIIKVMDGIASAVPDLVDRGFKAMIRMLNGMASAIRENDDQLIESFYNLGGAIVDGLIKGLGSLPKRLAQKLLGPVEDAYNKAKDFLGIHSPSKAFEDMGKNVVEGFGLGLDDKKDRVGGAVDGLANTAVARMSSKMAEARNAFGDFADIDPTITPILDLSKVKAGSQELQKYTSGTPVIGTASYGMGKTISKEKTANDVDAANLSERYASTNFKFEQHNHSPKALNTAEIYRNASNALAQAKREIIADIRRKQRERFPNGKPGK